MQLADCLNRHTFESLLTLYCLSQDLLLLILLLLLLLLLLLVLVVVVVVVRAWGSAVFKALRY
jgi:hypothetical protein